MGRHKKVGRKALSPAKKKESVNKANAKWQKENNKAYTLRFNLEIDKDVIEWLERQYNKAGSVKDLIREQIKREGN